MPDTHSTHTHARISSWRPNRCAVHAQTHRRTCHAQRIPLAAAQHRRFEIYSSPHIASTLCTRRVTASRSAPSRWRREARHASSCARSTTARRPATRSRPRRSPRSASWASCRRRRARRFPGNNLLQTTNTHTDSRQHTETPTHSSNGRDDDVPHGPQLGLLISGPGSSSPWALPAEPATKALTTVFPPWLGGVPRRRNRGDAKRRPILVKKRGRVVVTAIGDVRAAEKPVERVPLW